VSSFHGIKEHSVFDKKATLAGEQAVRLERKLGPCEDMIKGLSYESVNPNLLMLFSVFVFVLLSCAPSFTSAQVCLV
jgi:hypothetical protein